jgi:hypothetical protein
MAEKIALELDINAKGATTSLGQLEQEAERLNEELRKVPLGSQAFKDLKNELVGVSKEIKNTELSMEALDNEQVASELGSVAGAVGDVSAAFILLGGSGGPIEETVQNIEKAIGVSMAFKGAIEGTQSAMKLFNNVVKNSTAFQKANNATTIIASGVMKLFTGSVNTTSKAFKGLKAAIAATGIGLLVVGLGALIANFDKIKNAISGVSSATKDLVESTKLTNKLNEKNLETLNNQTNILKQQGFTERQIIKMKIDAQKQIVNGLIAEIEAQKLANKEKIRGSLRNQMILKFTLGIILRVPKTIAQLIDLMSEGLEGLINGITQSSVGRKLFGFEKIDIDLGLNKKVDDLFTSASAFIFNAEKTREEGQKDLEAIEENLLKQRDALAGFRLGLLDLDKKFENDRQKLIDENSQRAKIRNAELIDSDNKVIENKKNGILILGQLAAEEARIEKEKNDKIRADRQALEAATLEIASTTISTLIALNNSFAAEELDLSEQKKKAKENDDKAELKRLVALERANEILRKKAFERNKKLQIAQALIQTFQSANAAFASAAANPATILFPAYPGIMAGLAVAAGLANVNNIRKQKFQSSSAGTTPSISLPGLPTGNAGEDAPTIGPANTSTLIDQQPQRVFVTETDITNTQNNVAVIEGQSTFGGN